MLAVGTAVIGSLQFGYNTGVINAPQNVSIYICVRDEGKRREICEEKRIMWESHTATYTLMGLEGVLVKASFKAVTTFYP